ncbi:YncE family protein [Rhodococcoides yunnanense]|uniref:YncE family protein n=1 Tax=Rhodococcoides yunnanense TaxID=278209 RepID=UPI0009322DE1|nr:hypothetical protein [Rhodococcus yunnanensis]
MREARTPWRMVGVVAATTAILMAAGCSDDSSDDTDTVSVEPLTGIDSPVAATAPAGTITDSPSGMHSTTFDADTRSVVALADDYSSLLVFPVDATSDSVVPRVIELPGAATSIADGRDGTVLLPTDKALLEVDLRTSGVDSIAVDARLLSAVELPDGQLAAGDDRGTVHVLGSDGSESHTISGLTSVDSLASTQYGLTALDRHQTSLTEVKVDDDSLGLALRAGEGAAELDTDRFGRVLVTDAAGEELLVYSSESLLLRQRFPVGAQPWAVAYDDNSDVVWISLPATNEVVGYTLDTGIPVEVSRFPTVRQPDSIAVDSDTGDLYIGSATGDGLQRISVPGGQ